MIFHINNPVLKMDFMRPETYKRRGQQVAHPTLATTL